MTSDTDSGKDRGKIFLRVDPVLKDQWAKACQDRKIDQNAAGEAMVRLVVGMDPETQAMIFGQIPVRPDLLAVLLKRLGRRVRVAEDDPEHAKDLKRTQSEGRRQGARTDGRT